MAKRSLKSILQMDLSEINNLSKKNLKSLVAQLSKTSNRRASILLKHNIKNSAIKKFEAHGGWYSEKRRTLNQLRNEFKANYLFLNDKSSTITGHNKIRLNMKNRFLDILVNSGYELSKDKADIKLKFTDKFFELYNKATEMGAGEVLKKQEAFYTPILKSSFDIYEKNSSLSDAEIIQKMDDNFEQMYRERNRR